MPITKKLAVLFFAFWIPVILFAKLAGEVFEREPIKTDVSILQYIHAHATPFFDSLFLIITTAGNAEIILPIAAAVVLYFVYKKQRMNALLIAFAIGGAGIANFILKALFHRDRPAFWHSAITETSYSFPSGHAMLSSAFFLILIYIFWQTKYRIVVTIGASLSILLIGFSRLYMGVHYPTDIIAGWLVSFVWILIIVTASKRASRLFHQHDQTISKD